MKVIIEKPENNEEDQIIIRCHNVDSEILKIISTVKTYDFKIIGHDNERIYRLNLKDIYYFDTVDNKVFIYLKEKVFESKQKLYEIEEHLENTDFLRVSKSVILNLKKIDYLSPAFSGRFEAKLENGEKVIISRQYVPDFKKKLRLGE